jgi:hypothetical protein
MPLRRVVETGVSTYSPTGDGTTSGVRFAFFQKNGPTGCRCVGWSKLVFRPTVPPETVPRRVFVSIFFKKTARRDGTTSGVRFDFFQKNGPTGCRCVGWSKLVFRPTVPPGWHHVGCSFRFFSKKRPDGMPLRRVVEISVSTYSPTGDGTTSGVRFDFFQKNGPMGRHHVRCSVCFFSKKRPDGMPLRRVVETGVSTYSPTGDGTTQGVRFAFFQKNGPMGCRCVEWSKLVFRPTVPPKSK